MWGWIKKAAKGVVAGLKQLGNVLNELVNRIFGVFDFIASLFGLKLAKKLRLRVVILRDENRVALLGQGSRDDVIPSPVPYVSAEDEAKAAVELANAIFKRECNTRLVGYRGEPIVMVAPTAAPPAALDVHCNAGAWFDDFGGAGSFFRSLAAQMFAGLPVGYGSPVTVFVVRSVENKHGCSIGPLANYVTVAAFAMKGTHPRTLAHEVAHACGLWHVSGKDNLLNPSGSGEDLNRLQVAVFRNSPHVNFL